MSERRVRVRLGDRSYTVAIGRGLLDGAGRRVAAAIGRRPGRALLVSNATVWELYGERTRASLTEAGYRVGTHLIGDGERYKTLGEAERAIGAAAAAGLERGDPVIALGGGVVGDLAGLVAALYMRGTPCAQIPTTLLAQIDSSIGGKVAVNHARGKNLIGAFHQPAVVVADPDTLGTLPGRELRAGLFEAIKYGVLGDAALFRWMERHVHGLVAADPEVLGRLATVCCRIKARIVEADETESGLRRVLNLGHTAGHALETVTRYRRFLHGEAVGYGLTVAAELGVRLGVFAERDARRVRALLAAVGPLPRASDLEPERLLDAMRLDKKRTAGCIVFVVPEGLGTVTVRADVDDRTVLAALEAALQ